MNDTNFLSPNYQSTPLADRHRAFNEARNLMAYINIHNLPVNPFGIAETININVFSYSETEEFKPNTIQKLREKECAAIACRDKLDNRFYIMYDDKQLPERVRFTIAHEIGHIRLGHVSKQKDWIARKGCSRHKENDPIEKEADFFAGELLRPPVLLALVNAEEISEIQAICKISYTAAKIGSEKAKTIKEYMDRSYKDEKQFYLTHFHDFIYQKYCPTCKHYFIAPNANYCPICGNKSILWGNSLSPIYDFVGEVNYMIYPKYQLDQNGKAIICPRCNNEEIYQGYDYCKICGTDLINRCAGQEDIDWNENPYYVKEPCGTIADGNARYCIKCGAKTTFFEQGLLVSWEEEKKQKEAKEAAAVLPPPPPKLVSNNPLAPKKEWKSGEF